MRLFKHRDFSNYNEKACIAILALRHCVDVPIFLFLILTGISQQAYSQDKPDILFLAIDTLRADHVGCYGYDKPTTPFIDKFAKEGVLCEQAVSTSSWTTPSVMSMFTSLLPRKHAVLDTKCVIRDGLTTLAAELKKQGYYTCGILVNPCAGAKMGFDKGFEIYDDFTILLNFELNVFDVMSDKEDKKTIHNNLTSVEITNLAMKYFRKAPKDKPLFLFVFYFDPHGNYTPPQDYLNLFDPDYVGEEDGNVYGHKDSNYFVYENKRDLEHMIARYDAEIRYTDAEFHRLWNLAHKENLLDDNLLTIIVADHGEEFNEHGGLHHGRTLYEEVVKIPLIFHWPEKIPGGKVISRQVQHIDLMPTLLSLTGASIPEQCQGLDLSASLLGNGEVPEREMGMYLKIREELSAMRTPKYKAIFDAKNNKKESFNLLKDKKELTPLSESTMAANEPLKQMWMHLDRWHEAEEEDLAAYYKQHVKEDAKLSKQQIEALKAMGYVH